MSKDKLVIQIRDRWVQFPNCVQTHLSTARVIEAWYEPDNTLRFRVADGNQSTPIDFRGIPAAAAKHAIDALLRRGQCTIVLPEQYRVEES